MHDAQCSVHYAMHICRRVASRKHIRFNMIGHGNGHLLHHRNCLQNGIVAQLEGDYGIGEYELEDLGADWPLNAREECFQDLARPFMFFAFILVGHDHNLSCLGTLL